MGEGNTAGYVIVFFVVGVLVMIITLLALSFQRLESDEIGIVYDTIQKHLGSEVKQEGLHIGPVGFVFIKFPSVFKTLGYTDLTCLDKDGVPIVLDVAFQYLARPSDLHRIVMEFRDHENYVNVLTTAGEAAMHEACSKFNTSEFQSARALFTEEVRETLSLRFNDLSSDITDLQVNDITKPPAYERAVRDKEAARENIQVAENERPRQLTQARTTLREAETQAQIAINKAQSDARIAISRAEAEAAAITNEYQTEADTYATIIQSQGLTTEGFLAYMGVRAIGSSKNPVYAGVMAPAKTSYLGEKA
ncbi:uncharacterized protein LOC118407677 [Branchiostoma floridae]|uniref:Uncharacterized protein LOC118407677 n=1 Tax=Branchiostoma floridae TaxID=7739 RepID=C3YHV5_BRAFL|nr:uncharacterized protein LOC118407677 [Branchiostoma floridae]|eukprot:XP_002604081.1 hypothetical protein BRAFLDRAFT_71629 [Branchiostoma floridae]